MGKTNLHELSYGWTSNNEIFGPVRNRYHRDRVPGGSSGGSGTAVAARMAPLAIAEDTLGSIRVPASMCGLAGFRPTFGRYPNAGLMPLTGSKFDQIGPLARCVADLLLFDTALTGESGPMTTASLKGVRTLHSLSGFLEEQGTGMNFEQMLEQASEEIQAVIKGFALPPNRPSQEVYESMLV